MKIKNIIISFSLCAILVVFLFNIFYSAFHLNRCGVPVEYFSIESIKHSKERWFFNRVDLYRIKTSNNALISFEKRLICRGFSALKITDSLSGEGCYVEKYKNDVTLEKMRSMMNNQTYNVGEVIKFSDTDNKCHWWKIDEIKNGKYYSLNTDSRNIKLFIDEEHGYIYVRFVK